MWNMNPDAISASMYLFSGHYYPVKMVYVNMMNTGQFYTSLVNPDGDIIVDCGTHVYTFDNIGDETETNYIDTVLPEVPSTTTSDSATSSNGSGTSNMTQTLYENDEGQNTSSQFNNTNLGRTITNCSTPSRTILITITVTDFMTSTTIKVDTSTLYTNITQRVNSTFLGSDIVTETHTEIRTITSTIPTTVTKYITCTALITAVDNVTSTLEITSITEETNVLTQNTTILMYTTILVPSTIIETIPYTVNITDRYSSVYV